LRKVIFQNMVTLDGFFEGPDHDISWHMVDDEFNQYAIEFSQTIDLLLFGRKTYELMAGYWPSEGAKEDDPEVAEFMNRLPKIVFSKTLKHANWKNTSFIHEDAAQELMKLKQQPGKNIAIYGSANLALTFIENQLIDEFRIFINPVALGSGRTLFNGITGKLRFELTNLRTFNSGLILLTYIPLWNE
jgi:dihydrofolate reductase